MRIIGGDVSATIQLHGEIRQQLALYRASESHCQQHEIRLELELGTSHSLEARAPVGEYMPLQTDGMNASHSPILAGERGSGDIPLAVAPFLMRVGGPQLHWPQRPRCARRAASRWGRQKLELPNAARTLTNARPRAVRSGVTPADDNNPPIPRVDVFGFPVPGSGYREPSIG